MADAKLDRNLKLVIPIYGDGDTVVAYVHHTPISREVYEVHFRVMAKAFAAVVSMRDGEASFGPMIAHMLLVDEAKRTGSWDGEAGVKDGLVAEMRRLTNVLTPGPRGWQAMPYDDAVRGGTVDADDAAEVDNAIAFFTLASCVPARKNRQVILQTSSRQWGGQCTSSSVMEFAAGLPIPIDAAVTAQQKEAAARTASSIAS